MKSIRYKEILFLSYQEKKAKRINLDSDIVVIRGGNDAGKSCVLKSIFGVLGAEIRRYPENWNPDKILVLLKFTVDGVNFKALRIGNDFHLLSPDNKMFSITKDLREQADQLSKLFGLNVAYPSMNYSLSVGSMLMPFYIDQEDGWSQPWSSFSDVGNEQEKKNVMLLYTGAIDEQYYMSASRLISLKSKYQKWEQDKATQDNFINLIKDRLETQDLGVTRDDFKEEIQTFVEKIRDLKNSQNKILEELQSLYYDKMFKESRITKLHENMKAIEDDFAYALEQPEILTCPVCGAHTKNTAIARLGMKLDKEDCRELILQYQLELDDIDKEIEKAQAKSETIKAQIEDIEEFISTKKKEVSLEEYLDSQVTVTLRKIFHDKEVEYNDNLERLGTEIKEEQEKLAQMKTSSRLTVILQDFNYVFYQYQDELGIPKSGKPKVRKIGDKMNPTGSHKPKMALTFFFSYLYIMYKYGTPISAPLVIDEFKQNGLSMKGLNDLMEFAISHKKDGVQLIFSLLDEETVDNESARIIDLRGKHLMVEDEYKEVKKEIEDLMWKNPMLRNPE